MSATRPRARDLHGDPARDPLLLDLYELTMAQSYLAEGLAELPAAFSLFVRRLPAGWGYLVAAGLDDALAYLVAAGLDDALAYLEDLAFDEDALAFLDSTGRFGPGLLERLRRLRFTGSVRAVAEGTPVFADEPLLEVSGPLLEAQLVESVLVNQVHLQTLVATAAARTVEAAQGRAVIDFALRRSHGADAALKVARASFIGGVNATSNVLAGRRYGIPITGTMAHSYVECFPNELAAFRAFARSFPADCVLLIDTYDTLAGAQRAARVGAELAAGGGRLRGVRLDSGDLLGLARQVRSVLDGAGLHAATILASGGLDEHEVARLVAAGAPIDAFAVGTKVGVSAGAPYLDMAYKLVVVDGRPVLKLSAGKATLPGAKQVWRAAGGPAAAPDVVSLADERGPAGARPLLAEVMTGGRRRAGEPLAAARERWAAARAGLPDDVRGVDGRAPSVLLSERLQDALASAAADARRVNVPGAPDPTPAALARQ